MTAITTGGSGNWSSTTPNAPWPSGTVPVEGDTVTIASGHTVTIDQNITVGADTSTAAINIASGGKLEVLSTVSSDYTLTCKGDLKISGTLEIGTTSNPIPNTRTFTLKLNYSASLSACEYGMIIGDSAGATVTIQGASMTYYACLLAANASAGATSITTSVSTGWKDNDVLGLASTTRTYTQSEKLVMNGDASGTTISFDSPASLAYAHSGTSPTQAEIINLTRNVKITAYDTGYPGYILLKHVSNTINWDWAEFSYLGTGTTDKYGICWSTATATNTINIRYCSIHDGNRALTWLNNVTAIDIQDCVIYGMTGGYGLHMDYGVANESTVKNIYIMNLTSAASAGLMISPAAQFHVDFSYIYISGVQTYGVEATSITWDYSVSPDNYPSFSYITVHSTGSGAVRMIYPAGTWDHLTVWRANSYGILSSANTPYKTNRMGSLVTNSTLFGNTSSNYWNSGGNMTFRGCSFDSDASYTTTYGIGVGTGWSRTVFENCTFGTNTAHDSASISMYSTSITAIPENIFINCTFGDSTEIYRYYENMQGYCISHKHDGVEGDHRYWCFEGRRLTDTSVYKTASPSEKIIPYWSAYKMESHPRYITCGDGLTRTVKVWVRKSAAYNGDEPRLILKRNYAAGVTSDTVLDTMTAAVETWEQLSGVVTAPSEDTVYELVVDCAGSNSDTKYINVDDWSVE